MKKKYIISILILILISYLYLSYAHIYERNKTMNLPSSQKQKEYILGKNFQNKLTYVPFGDSLTAGVGVDEYAHSYPYQFAQKVSQKNSQQITLIPFAIPGAKTSDAIAVLLEGVVATKPDVITMLFGVNDVHGRVSEEDFYTQYKTILEKITKETDAVVYVIAIPYIGAPSLILPPYDLYFDAQTKKFNTILEKLAQEYPVKYVDLYTPTRESAGKEQYYSSDLFHPSFIGYTLWAQILYDAFDQ